MPVMRTEIKNTTNRRVNFEVANYIKTNEAALKQQMAIEKIVLEHGWQSLAPELAAVAKLRLENTDMSLAEIAQKLNIGKHFVCIFKVSDQILVIFFARFSEIVEAQIGDDRVVFHQKA